MHIVMDKLCIPRLWKNCGYLLHFSVCVKLKEIFHNLCTLTKILVSGGNNLLLSNFVHLFLRKKGPFIVFFFLTIIGTYSVKLSQTHMIYYRLQCFCLSSVLYISIPPDVYLCCFLNTYLLKCVCFELCSF